MTYLSPEAERRLAAMSEPEVTELLARVRPPQESDDPMERAAQALRRSRGRDRPTKATPERAAQAFVNTPADHEISKETTGMSWNSPREAAVYRVQGGRKQVADRGIKFPKAVLDALAVFDRIEADTPRQPSQTAIREAILTGADQDEINALLLADLGAQRLRGEHAQARIDSAVRVLRAIRAAHDDIYPQLKALADMQIAHLEAVARLDGARLEDLVRAGRHDDAQALATVDVAAAELNTLWSMRDTFIVDRNGTTVGMVNCSRWRDPRPVERHHRGDETLAQSLVNGLRNGGELWYPTHAEAIAAAEPIDANARAAAQRLAEIQRAQGFTVAVT
jgi:hypothetical protein